MNTIRQLSKDQRKFLGRLRFKLERIHREMGHTMVYQFDVMREVDFIDVVLSRNEYSILEDSDRLNSLRSLWGYTKNIQQHV